MDHFRGTTVDRHALVEKWLAEVLQSYPEPSRRLAAGGTDRFRHPAGHTVQHGLAMILEAVLSGSLAGAGRPLDDIIHLHVAQGFDAERAVAFLRPLAGILEGVRRADGHPVKASGFDPGICSTESSDDVVARLVAMASDLFAACQQSLAQITSNEAKRQTWMQDRLQRARAAGRTWSTQDESR